LLVAFHHGVHCILVQVELLGNKTVTASLTDQLQSFWRQSLGFDPLSRTLTRLNTGCVSSCNSRTNAFFKSGSNSASAAIIDATSLPCGVLRSNCNPVCAIRGTAEIRYCVLCVLSLGARSRVRQA
jgi:hypothetical protein